MGWFVEQMIQSVKRCLNKQLGQSRTDYEQLHTLLVEIQTVVNSRVLMSLYEEPVEEVLSSNHLLFGRKNH